MNQNQNIAVFIDGDNVSSAHYQKILDELRRDGRILIQRLYADFSKPDSERWKDVIINYGMEAIQTFRVAKKESTDNALIVDCMRTLYNHKNIHVFVIVSSDSDFSSLASEIRLKGQFCIGVGYNHTPLKLRNNCDRFISIEHLLTVDEKEDKEEKKEEKDKNNKDIKYFLKQYFQSRPLSTPLSHLIEICKRSGFKDNIKNLQFDEMIISSSNMVYWLMLGEDNVRTLALKIIEEHDKPETHMSWLKERMLNVNSSFDQRLWGFMKMNQFSELIIAKTDYKLGKDKNGEYIVTK